MRFLPRIAQIHRSMKYHSPESDTLLAQIRELEKLQQQIFDSYVAIQEINIKEYTRIIKDLRPTFPTAEMVVDINRIINMMHDGIESKELWINENTRYSASDLQSKDYNRATILFRIDSPIIQKRTMFVLNANEIDDIRAIFYKRGIRVIEEWQNDEYFGLTLELFEMENDNDKEK